MSISLDRFAYGLPDPQAADYTICPDCGGEVYGDYCEYCAQKRLDAAIASIEDVIDKHYVELKGRGPNIIIVDCRTGHEEYL